MKPIMEVTRYELTLFEATLLQSIVDNGGRIGAVKAFREAVKAETGESPGLKVSKDTIESLPDLLRSYDSPVPDHLSF